MTTHGAIVRFKFLQIQSEVLVMVAIINSGEESYYFSIALESLGLLFFRIKKSAMSSARSM